MSKIYPIVLANSYKENCLVTREDNADDAAIFSVIKNMFSECFIIQIILGVERLLQTLLNYSPLLFACTICPRL